MESDVQGWTRGGFGKWIYCFRQRLRNLNLATAWRYPTNRKRLGFTHLFRDTCEGWPICSFAVGRKRVEWKEAMTRCTNHVWASHYLLLWICPRHQLFVPCVSWIPTAQNLIFLLCSCVYMLKWDIFLYGHLRHDCCYDTSFKNLMLSLHMYKFEFKLVTSLDS